MSLVAQFLDPATIERWNSKRFGGVGTPKLALRTYAVRLLVVHTTEGHETSSSPANACAWWDNPAAKGNAHIVVGGGRIVQFAPDNRQAWHAGKHGNPRGLGLEICGKAAQSGPPAESPLADLTQYQWGDDYSMQALRDGVRVLAHWSLLYGIETRRLTDEEVRDACAGRGTVTGICGHVDVDRAHGVTGRRYDPGPQFPWAQVLLGVRGYVEHARSLAAR